ncbi:MAG: NAD(P)-dependent oxidoreductase [Defluviitaleaceae bacterium]|nr:NAD(P)-dependent oxidoreductase [Defluviitaleaceae bacterium]
MKLGFIGTGVMGQAMAHHLQVAGHQLFVYNRTKDKAQSLIESGATWCDDVKTVAQHADLIFTMIGMPSDVASVYLSEEGLINQSKPGTILVDMTTSQPELAKKIYDLGIKKDIYCVDAPVTGGDVGAQNATLTLFLGGDEAICHTLMPYFKLMGRHITYLGPAGSGQHGKMTNQIAISGAVIGMVESLAYAKAAGIDLATLQEAISTGSGGSWQMSNMAPRAIAGDFDPGFYIKHFIKDMKIAVDEAKASGIQLPGLELTLSQYEKLADLGLENLGTQGLYKLYDD